MTANKDSRIAIIGAGKVGCALGRILLENGYPVTFGVRDTSQVLPVELGKHDSWRKNFSVLENTEAVRKAKLIIIAVQDKQIQSVCESIVNHIAASSIVAHCSGALDSSVLDSAKTAGHKICSLHPLNTFPTHAAAQKTFADNHHQTALYGEGDDSALEHCFPLFTELGFLCTEIESEAKPLYHVACVFASNYLVTLMDMSLQTGESAGIERKQFWQSLQPLITTTTSNIGENGTVNALSGPVARGDTATIQKHLTALEKDNSPLANSYIDLAQKTLLLAEQNGDISAETLQQIEKLLKENIPPK
jgi:predicted short-subunit dehydrogenase-like oxidoreductase (DUF2520 family)